MREATKLGTALITAPARKPRKVSPCIASNSKPAPTRFTDNTAQPGRSASPAAMAKCDTNAPLPPGHVTTGRASCTAASKREAK